MATQLLLPTAPVTPPFAAGKKEQLYYRFLSAANTVSNLQTVPLRGIQLAVPGRGGGRSSRRRRRPPSLPATPVTRHGALERCLRLCVCICVCMCARMDVPSSEDASLGFVRSCGSASNKPPRLSVLVSPGLQLHGSASSGAALTTRRWRRSSWSWRSATASACRTPGQRGRSTGSSATQPPP